MAGCAVLASVALRSDPTGADGSVTTLRGQTPVPYDPARFASSVTTAWVSCTVLARKRYHSSVASGNRELKQARNGEDKN
jgi:hypothetical protein